MIGNIVGHSSKQVFISAPQNWCNKKIGKFPKKVDHATKSIGKVPKNVAHASFLQSLAYIVLDQDEILPKKT